MNTIETNINRSETKFNSILPSHLPGRNLEAWRFTSLAELKDTCWAVSAENETSLTHDDLKKISLHLSSEFHHIVFVDGVLNKTLSDEIVFLAVSNAIDNDFVVSEKNVDLKLIQLAKEFGMKSIKLHLKNNEILDKPLHLLFVQSGKVNSYTSYNVNIQLGENAETKVISQSISLSDIQKTMTNIFCKVDCSKNAKLKLIQIQNENEASYHLAQTLISAHEDSQIQHFNISLGCKIVRNYLEINFDGMHANGEALGIVAIGHKQHVDNYTVINHIKGHNNSNQIYKSILADEAHSVFRGVVRIEPNAQKANSEQLNNNLLLGKKSHADSIPQLEIYADDVKAGHGSTVGQLNSDEVFYLQSRAIDRVTAIKMLAEGYAQELIYKIEDPKLINWLKKILGGKLEGIISNV